MATLEAGLTRDEAFALLQEHNKDPLQRRESVRRSPTWRYHLDVLRCVAELQSYAA